MRILKAVMIILVIIGIGFLAYPTASAFIADYTSTKVMIDYDKQMKNLERIEMQQRKQKAEEFNAVLSNISITAFKESSKEKTKEIKNEIKSGEMLGYIIIDKIDVNLPIYEGTHESVLLKGIGHMKDSFLPMGGKGTHSVLTGHSGMASATLFSRLDELKVGDVFIIRFLDKFLAYQVDKVSITEPTEADELIKITPKKDYVTLVTCTPKTVNTHRLLVRGTRIPYKDEKELKEKTTAELYEKQSNMAMKLCLIVSFLYILLIIVREVSRKRSKYEKYN